MGREDVLYLRRMAVALRWRRIPEPRVREVLAEIAAAVRETGGAEATFGPVTRYARRMGRGRAWPVGYVLGNALAVVVFLVWGVVAFTFWDDGHVSALVAVPGMVLAVAAVFGCFHLGQLVDRRMPPGIIPGPRPPRPSAAASGSGT